MSEIHTAGWNLTEIHKLLHRVSNPGTCRNLVIAHITAERMVLATPSSHYFVADTTRRANQHRGSPGMKRQLITAALRYPENNSVLHFGDGRTEIGLPRRGMVTRYVQNKIRIAPNERSSWT